MTTWQYLSALVAAIPDKDPVGGSLTEEEIAAGEEIERKYLNKDRESKPRAITDANEAKKLLGI